MELVTVGTMVGATVPATLEHTLCNALVDTGVTRSCLSEEYYQQLLLPGLKPVHKLQVRTASGSSLCPTGKIMCNFKLGKQLFFFEFISRCLHRIRDTSKQSKLYSVKCFIPK